jgi:hypothetical protein
VTRTPALALLISLVACGSKDTSDADATSNDGTTAEGDADTDADADADTDPTSTGTETVDVGLYINEIVASNATGLQDESGSFPDWVELWNSTGADVDLGGWYLTDDDTWTDKWAFAPGTVVPAGGYLVVFCDGDVLDGTLHTSYSLSSSGEFVGLYTPLAEGNAQADAEEFPLAATDVSWARLPDGGAFGDDPTPTPGAPNG